MIVTLIRHAETEGNLKRLFVGRIDQPLAEEGIRNAENSPHYPIVSKVYTSNLKRTIQTAQILFPNAEIEEISDLREIDFGEIEGMSHDELMADPKYSKLFDKKSFPQAPGGENLEVFTNRCVEAFRRIIAEEKEVASKDVYFVLHGGTIMTLLHELATPQRDFFDWRVNNCKGFRLEIEHNAKGDVSLIFVSEV